MDSIKQAMIQKDIMNKIHYIRGQKVMLDRDLAEFYGVTTTVLNQAVSRQNVTNEKKREKRFDPDFMFQLTKEEFNELKSQYETPGRGGIRKLPNAFTDLGIFMLSGVLNSDQAIAMHKQILRTFKKMNEIIRTQAELSEKVQSMEKTLKSHDNQIGILIDTVGQLALDDHLKENKKPLGFPTDEVKSVDSDKKNNR